MGPRGVAATAEERRRPFPGDALVEDSLGTWTHGVTIGAPPRTVWPWLAQMGVGRAGWYSWDFIDNGGHRSASELVAAWERVDRGDLMPAGPGVTTAFVVERVEPGRDLVLGVPHDGGLLATWEFLLDPLPGGRTRLLVRTRVSPRGWLTPLGPVTRRAERVYRALARLPRGPILALARAGHRLMQARQLRGIRRRVEAHLPRAAAAGAGKQRLSRLVTAGNGMHVFGQGGWIMLFTAPSMVAAVLADLFAPGLVELPLPASVLAPPGVALLVLGIALWLTAVSQLVTAFSRGELVTTGAYGVCRNPIYSSIAFFVLPGLALLSGTWVYLVVALVLCAGVLLFIRNEERDLLRVFGDEYRRYTARVHRLIPFVKPARGLG